MIENGADVLAYDGTGGRGDLFGAIWRSGDGGDTFETLAEKVLALDGAGWDTLPVPGTPLAGYHSGERGPLGDPSRAPGPQDPVRLRIFDVGGRLIRQVDLRLPLTGRLAWTWDLRDGAGRRVPAGPHEIVLQHRAVRTAQAPARSILVLP